MVQARCRGGAEAHGKFHTTRSKPPVGTAPTGSVVPSSAASTPCATTAPSCSSSRSASVHTAPYTFASDACDSYEVATTRAPFRARANASEKEKSPSPTVRIDCPCLYRPIDMTRGILAEFAARTSRKHVSGLAFGSDVQAPCWFISTLAQHGTQPDSAHWTVSTMTCNGPSSPCRWSAVALGAGMDVSPCEHARVLLVCLGRRF